LPERHVDAIQLIRRSSMEEGGGEEEEGEGRFK
jgi:hypothetical protein